MAGRRGEGGPLDAHRPEKGAHADFFCFFFFLSFAFYQLGLPSPLQGEELRFKLAAFSGTVGTSSFSRFPLWLPCKASQALGVPSPAASSASWLGSPAHLLWAKCPVIVHEGLCAGASAAAQLEKAAH